MHIDKETKRILESNLPSNVLEYLNKVFRKFERLEDDNRHYEKEVEWLRRMLERGGTFPPPPSNSGQQPMGYQPSNESEQPRGRTTQSPQGHYYPTYPIYPYPYYTDAQGQGQGGEGGGQGGGRGGRGGSSNRYDIYDREQNGSRERDIRGDEGERGSELQVTKRNEP